MTRSGDALPTLPSAPVPPAPGLFQRLPRALPAVVFLVAGGMALLAYLALPWETQTCFAVIVRSDPTCPAYAAAHSLYAVDSYGPMGSKELHWPLTAYLMAQLAYFGPAVLCLFAGLSALAAHRSVPWRRASVALGAIGGLTGTMSWMVIVFVLGLGSALSVHAAVGFYVALASFALALLGAIVLLRRYAHQFDLAAR